jgi:hypothetical protein
MRLKLLKTYLFYNKDYIYINVFFSFKLAVNKSDYMRLKFFTSLLFKGVSI